MSSETDVGAAVAAAERVPFRIELRHPVRGVVHRQGWLIRGPVGWGEFSPLPGSSEQEMTRCLAAAWEVASKEPPAPQRDRVEANALVPEVTPGVAAHMVVASGCQTAKVKVGPSPADPHDRRRLESVREALGSKGKLRIDINGAWDVEMAADWISEHTDLDIELVEQPVQTLEELAELRRLVTVPLAADEAVRTVDDAIRLRELDAADAVVIKLQTVGGYSAALRIAEEVKVPVIVSSPLETAVGTMASARLAASLDDLPYACGLAAHQLLARDICDVRMDDGSLVLSDLQITPERLALIRFSA